MRWLAGWEAELDSGGAQDWVKRVNLGEEKGGESSSWLENLLSWAANLFWQSIVICPPLTSVKSNSKQCIAMLRNASM